MPQLEELLDALTASDKAEAIKAVLRHLEPTSSAENRQHLGTAGARKFLEAAASLPSADPALLRYFQRKFRPYSLRPVAASHAFYGVRLCHFPEVYTSWKDV